MYAISTAAFVSILALASSLAVVVQAGEPRLVCYETDNFPPTLTCDQLLRDFLHGISVEMLLIINPGKGDCNSIIASGSACAIGKFPTCKTEIIAGPKVTKCDELVTANNITKDLFIDYNDDVDVNNCSGVVPGHKYCVAIYGE